MKQNHFHFIGLGGIGMSALARILLQRNAHVSGSDVAMSDALQELSALGATVSVGHTAGAVPKEATVVYKQTVVGTYELQGLKEIYEIATAFDRDPVEAMEIFGKVQEANKEHFELTQQALGRYLK